MTSTGAANEHFHVAIIGAGITGISLALGLESLQVPFTVYERAPSIGEIGAGIGFSPNAERAMGALNPEVLAAFRGVANPNGEDSFQWADGHRSDEIVFKLDVGKDGFQGCLRSEVLEEWAKLLPPGVVRCNKELEAITEPEAGSSEQLHLHFRDGTTAPADVVVGCDGIRSRVRRLIVPASCSAAAHPSYTRKFCFRALAPMGAARQAIGTYRASTRVMYNGPGAHIITYPVANSTLLNILAVMSDPSPSWRHQTAHGRHTAAGTKAEAEKAFQDWHPTAQRIISLLPDKMDKWGIFDMAEHLAPAYTSGAEREGKGRVCVAGDAAHAAGPHLGAGAGMGIEDALVLARLLSAVRERVSNADRDGRINGFAKGELVVAALAAYNEVRYDRTQEVVQSTRLACEMFQSEIGRDPERFGHAITPLFHKVWDYDNDGMLKDALERLDGKCKSTKEEA